MSVIGVKRPSTKLSGAIHLTGNMPVIHVRKKKKLKVLNVKNSSANKEVGTAPNASYAMLFWPKL